MERIVTKRYLQFSKMEELNKNHLKLYHYQYHYYYHYKTKPYNKTTILILMDVKSNIISKTLRYKILSMIYHMILINERKIKNLVKTCNVTV